LKLLNKALRRLIANSPASQRRSRKPAYPLHRAVLETLENRQLLSALYWDTSSAPGLQAGNGTWSTSAANWNTAFDGSGSNVVWTAGSDAVFSANGTSTISLSGTINANSITASGTGYSLSGGSLNLAGTSSVTQDLTISGTGSRIPEPSTGPVAIWP
jgi:hypothetical protein